MQTVEEITGAIPAGTTHFKVNRRSGEAGSHKWEACFAEADDGADAKVALWALESFDLEAIRDAWGAGIYRVTWFEMKDGKYVRRAGRMSRVFELTEARRAPRGRNMPAPPPPATPAAPSATSESFAMIQMANTLAASQVAMVQAMAQQQVSFMQEHSRISQEQMSQHYSAMLKAQKSNEGPLLQVVRDLGRRLNDLEQYEPEPEQIAPAQVEAPRQRPISEWSVDEWAEAAKKHGPDAFAFVNGVADAIKKRKAAAE